MFFVTEDWYFCSHRLPLAAAAAAAGYDVSVVTRVRRHGDVIRSAGLRLIPLELSRRGKNPFLELLVLTKLRKIYRTHAPDIVHHVAMKPVLYGSLAARWAGVPHVVNALAGLGYLYSSGSVKARLSRPLVKLVLRMTLRARQSSVILQNPDDIELLTESGVIDRSRVTLIRGSGVDLTEFAPSPEPAGVPIVMLAARMLRDKGVGEFVAAAKQLQQRGVRARFVLVGESDVENPSAIPDEQLQAWRQDGAVEIWGHQSNMAMVIAQSHVICLPSYREGLPKVLIEAAACGRPIVATDVPGNREVVRDGRNGLLVPVRNANALAAALESLLAAPELRRQMGIAGRRLAEQEFSVGKVIDQTLAVYKAVAA